MNYIKAGYSSPGFSIGEIKTAKSVLLVAGKADVRQFKKSFKRAFGSGDSLSRYLSRVISDSLNRISGVSICVGPAGYSDSLDGDSILKSEKFFKSIDAGYIINIKNLVIDNSTQNIPGILAPSGPGGRWEMTGGGVSTSCVFSYDVEIWDLRSMTEKASFKTTGTSQVFMFFYQKALENAVWNSIHHLVGYVRDGRTEF
jgi:hypothetical protein